MYTLQQFLDHPKVLMVLTQQHHFVYHPKLVTLPLGLRMGVVGQDLDTKLMLATNRDVLLTTSLLAYKGDGSPVRPFRLRVHNCVKKIFKDRFVVPNRSLTYTENLMGWVSAKYVLALPGLGWDCWRVWESLWMGAVPVLVKGMGFEQLFAELH